MIARHQKIGRDEESSPRKMKLLALSKGSVLPKGWANVPVHKLQRHE
jgi:hypothetical protein